MEKFSVSERWRLRLAQLPLSAVGRQQECASTREKLKVWSENRCADQVFSCNFALSGILSCSEIQKYYWVCLDPHALKDNVRFWNKLIYEEWVFLFSPYESSRDKRVSFSLRSCRTPCQKNYAFSHGNWQSVQNSPQNFSNWNELLDLVNMYFTSTNKQNKKKNSSVHKRWSNFEFSSTIDSRSWLNVK